MSQLLERIPLSTPPGELYTEDDLEQMPSSERYELICGKLYPMPNNSAEHGNKTMRISGEVYRFVEENDLGECFAAETRFTIAKDPDTTLGPDFAFIAKERLAGIPPKGYLRLAPDLAIETRSPGDARGTFEAKIGQWLDAGVRLVWAVEPAKRIVTAYRSGVAPVIYTIDETLSGEDVLPGFTFALKRLFRDVAPTESPKE